MTVVVFCLLYNIYHIRSYLGELSFTNWMSIAKIITDAFREDKFGHEFISHSEERLQAMNDAQLAGVERFLLPMIANSKIHYIRDAFRELEGKTR